MAATAYHTCSNSLPSSSHPLTSEFDEQLSRLKASEATSTSICHKLNGLQDLHHCIDKLMQLPLTQKALTQKRHKKWFDELLDGTVRLLDVCSTSKDALLQMKECTRELQSVLRRRRGGKFELACEVKKCMENKHALSLSSQEEETAAIAKMLREVEAITLSVLKSMLFFISGPKSSSKLSGWSLVSNLMNKRKVACEEEETDNEITKVDAALHFMYKTNVSDSMTEVENVQNDLQNLELSIQDFEDGLESAYRGLIKSRVSILNILNH